MKKTKIEFKDIDIATVEAMRDKLLDNKIIERNDLLFTRSIDVTNKMYVLVYPVGYSSENRNILEHSNDIIFGRKEEKEREYGPFDESMDEAAKIASIMTNKHIATEDMYKILIALKLGRLKYNNKYDTILDAIGYLAGLNDYVIKNSKINE